MEGVRYVGVSKLVYVLFAERFQNIFVSYEKLKQGIWYHRKFGFDQQEIKTECFYKYKGQVFLIRGKPDEVYVENGRLVISELKTCKSEQLRNLMGLQGWLQANIYAYMLSRGKNLETIVNSYVYNPCKDVEPKLYLSRPADYKLADWTIRRGLDVILKDAECKEEVIQTVKNRLGLRY